MFKKILLIIGILLLTCSVASAGRALENGTDKGAFTDLNIVGASVSGGMEKLISVNGKANVEIIATTDTIVAADLGKVFIVTPISTSAGSFTLPEATGSFNTLKFIDGKAGANTNTFSVDPYSTDIIMKSISSVALHAGDKLTSTGQTGDVLELIDGASGVWYIGGEVGVWTDGG